VSSRFLCHAHVGANVLGMTETGRRERKKQHTRDLISNVATRLFATKGFEQTTIAEVAAAADVAKMTVTNYFPLKEDLVFDRHEEITRLLADGVTNRSAGTSVIDAVQATYLAELDARNPILGFLGPAFADLVQGSPALMIREREIFAAQEAALADVLTARFASSDGDLRPRLAAAQLAGVVRVLYFEGRRRLIAGELTDDIVRALRRAARSAFTALEPALPAAYRR
jgi:AcrR family transcriptional regulator